LTSTRWVTCSIPFQYIEYRLLSHGWYSNDRSISERKLKPVPEKLAVTQQVKRLIFKYNSKFNCRIHKRPPLIPILRQTNRVHTFQLCLFVCDFHNILWTRLGVSSGLFSSGFWQKFWI
jgi:hypothetical protein